MGNGFVVAALAVFDEVVGECVDAGVNVVWCGGGRENVCADHGGGGAGACGAGEVVDEADVVGVVGELGDFVGVVFVA